MGLDLARGRWRTLAASVAGTSHARAGQPCADACAVRVLPARAGGSLLVAVAADGAGTSARAPEGARLACEAIVGQAEALGRAAARGAAPARRRRATWPFAREDVAALRRAARGPGSREAARRERRDRRDFSCTLLVALVDERTAAFFQIGDGAIVYRARGRRLRARALAAERRVRELHLVRHRRRRGRAACRRPAAEGVHEVALLTDGLQGARAALRQPRGPRRPSSSRCSRGCGASPRRGPRRLDGELRAFLDSPAVNQRTDDDKTLVLATRLRPERGPRPRAAEAASAMRTFCDLQGQETSLGRCLGQGGEGAVYSVPERPADRGQDLRAPARRATRAASSGRWSSSAPRRSRRSPPGRRTCCTTRARANVVGFLMPRVDGHREIHALYGPTDRKTAVPGRDLDLPGARGPQPRRRLRHRAPARPRGRRREPGQRGRLAQGHGPAHRLRLVPDHPPRAHLPLPRRRPPLHAAGASGPQLDERRAHARPRPLRPRRPGLPPALHGPPPLRRDGTPSAAIPVETAIREGLFAFGREAARQGWRAAALLAPARGRDRRPSPSSSSAPSGGEATPASRGRRPRSGRRRSRRSRRGSSSAATTRATCTPQATAPAPGAASRRTAGPRSSSCPRAPRPTPSTRPRPGGRSRRSSRRARRRCPRLPSPTWPRVGGARDGGAARAARPLRRRRAPQLGAPAQRARPRGAGARDLRAERAAARGPVGRAVRREPLRVAAPAARGGARRSRRPEGRSRRASGKRSRAGTARRSSRPTCESFELEFARIPGLGPAELGRLASRGITTAAHITPEALMALRGIDLDLVKALLLYKGVATRALPLRPRDRDPGPGEKGARRPPDAPTRRAREDAAVGCPRARRGAAPDAAWRDVLGRALREQGAAPGRAAGARGLDVHGPLGFGRR